ncbi:hypothetical protein R1flu_018084 [Riccia fluitans]|uniref:Uncharacterized protein n=1 Tax=Riccia fluitans TaxID=41844 RepID=A0ABD1ZH46_9MARC
MLASIPWQDQVAEILLAGFELLVPGGSAQERSASIFEGEEIGPKEKVTIGLLPTDLSWSVAGMERSEPSLVPEWLKGAGVGGGATHHSQPPVHQDEVGGSFPTRQRSQAAAGGNHGDYDSPRYSSASDRTYYSNSRRGGNNSSSAIDRPLFERDPYSRAYSSFGQRSGYRGVYDGSDRDRDTSRDRDRDWDWERDRDREFRDRERDRTLGFGGGDERDRDRDRPDGSFRRPTGVSGRYDPDVTLRRSQSMGSGRAVENGEKKAAVDSGTLPTAPPANSGTLTGSMQKAAFERNFPSLGAQEKQGPVQSTLGNVSVLSPRPSWQSSSPRTDGTRSPGLTSGVTAAGAVAPSLNVGVTGIAGEGWSSALAEVPASLTTTSTINGVAAGGASTPLLSGAGSGLATGGAPALIVPKMAEALTQNPPRVRTPPQYSTESQRLEDAALKQSRQLIPMKPSLPKNMGQRDKIKPKVVRAVDVVAPQPIKLQSLTSSQLLASPFRPPASPRQEPLKVPQGKLLARRPPIKEAGSAAVGSLKTEGGPSSSSLVSPASAVVGLGGVSANSNAPAITAPVPRKQKQLLDRRAVPIPPTSIIADLGSGSRSKEGSAVSEDKRPAVPAQNRSDFFNALRKKAAGVGGGSGNSEKMDSAPQLKNGSANGKSVELEDDISSCSGEGIDKPVYKPKENGVTANLGSKSNNSDLATYGTTEEKDRGPTNGASEELTEGNFDQFTAPSSPVAPVKRATATEEEEAAFLRSLGWEESAEESGEGLTEEEINSFYQERLRSMSISPSLPAARNHHVRGFQMETHVGSIGSISSGISSSDSDSDDDLHVRRR